jgi:excisionase family DNA binding protein
MRKTMKIENETKEMKLLTKREAAAILRVSVRTLENYIKAGVIKPIRIGSTVRFPADILTAIQQTAA